MLPSRLTVSPMHSSWYSRTPNKHTTPTAGSSKTESSRPTEEYPGVLRGPLTDTHYSTQDHLLLCLPNSRQPSSKFPSQLSPLFPTHPQINLGGVALPEPHPVFTWDCTFSQTSMIAGLIFVEAKTWPKQFLLKVESVGSIPRKMDGKCGPLY
jgi:hypothetical protein